MVRRSLGRGRQDSGLLAAAKSGPLPLTFPPDFIPAVVSFRPAALRLFGEYKRAGHSSRSAASPTFCKGGGWHVHCENQWPENCRVETNIGPQCEVFPLQAGAEPKTILWTRYRRDFTATAHTPDVQWPGGARIAVQFVLNYEEGGENVCSRGRRIRAFLVRDGVGAAPGRAAHWIYGIYLRLRGLRAGFWRLARCHRCPIFPVHRLVLCRHPPWARPPSR